MIRLLAKRNNKARQKNYKTKNINEDYIIYNLDNDDNVLKLKLTNNNLHILFFDNINITNITSIDDLIPNIASDFLQKEQDIIVRLIYFQKNPLKDNLINNSVYFWSKLGDNIFKSNTIEIIFVHQDNILNWNSETKEYSIMVYNILQNYDKYIQDKECLAIVITDNNYKLFSFKQNVKLSNKTLIYNKTEKMNFIIENISNKYEFFNPVNIDIDIIKKNYSFYTKKKQDIVKRIIEGKLNDMLLKLYPVFKKMSINEAVTPEDNSDILYIMGKNANININTLRNYISTNIYNFCKYLTISESEVDILVGSFMEAIDNLDNDKISDIINNNINSMLMSNYNFYYIFDSNEEYASSSSYYTSDED